MLWRLTPPGTSLVVKRVPLSVTVSSKHRLLPGSSCSQLDSHSSDEPVTVSSVEITKLKVVL